jgi:hypothetical protein
VGGKSVMEFMGPNDQSPGAGEALNKLAKRKYGEMRQK